MDLDLTQEQALLRDTVIRFTRESCDDALFRRMDEEAYYPHDLYKEMGRLGFLGISLPERYGGSGLGCVECTLFQEELSKRLLPLQMTYQISVLSAGTSILALGSEAQRQRYLPGLAKGAINFAVAFTEPAAGSDAAAVTLAAQRDGDRFLLNGQKIFISAANIADFLLVSTRTDAHAPKRDGITAFIVDARSPGLTIRPIAKLGVKANAYCEVFFEDVAVPADDILNGLGRGWEVVTHTLELDRIGAAARWVGIAQEALDYAKAYAKQRKQFGKSIASLQSMRDLFADMQTRIDAARLLTYRGALLLDKGAPCRKEASMAKLYASELVVELTRAMMQVLGGYSYAMEYHAQRYLRDSLFATIGAGTSQIQRLIIANELGL